MHRPNRRYLPAHRERGQTTIAMVAVILLCCLAGFVIMSMAEAMVHRARARTAADAVALAVAADPAAGRALITKYREAGIAVEHDGVTSTAHSGPSQALAWAENSAAPDQPAPALVAILARAEQLTGATFTNPRWDGISVALHADQAAQLQLVAADLGLCERVENDARADSIVFVLC